MWFFIYSLFFASRAARFPHHHIHCVVTNLLYKEQQVACDTADLLYMVIYLSLRLLH